MAEKENKEKLEEESNEVEAKETEVIENKIETELDELNDRYKRLFAEFENYKKEKGKEDPEDKAIRIRLDKKRTKQPEER